MVGVPFNPDNCAFIANQALNTNQFNGNVPNSANQTTHTVLWDFVEEKLYWVNTQTNIIENEIPGTNACDFYADISYVGASETGFNYNCVAFDGVAPYTYQWSIEAAPQLDFSIVGSSTAQSVEITTTGLKELNFGLLKCKVTDAEGCVTSATFAPYVIVAP
jgi:hypothetical protein